MTHSAGLIAELNRGHLYPNCRCMFLKNSNILFNMPRQTLSKIMTTYLSKQNKVTKWRTTIRCWISCLCEPLPMPIMMWKYNISKHTHLYSPFGLVQAPNRFTTFRWLPMWIRIFNSDIKALCSLAVAPSETHTHTPTKTHKIHLIVCFCTCVLFMHTHTVRTPCCTCIYQSRLANATHTQRQTSPFSILTATVSKLLLLLMP